MNQMTAIEVAGETVRRPRVVFVLPDLGGGGAQRVMLTFARNLDVSRFEPHIFVLGRDRTIEDSVPAHVPVRHFDAARLRSALPALVGAIRSMRPDAVVSVMGYVNLALLAAKPLFAASTRLVVREANVLDATLRALPRWLPARAAYRHLYPRAAAVIVPTRAIGEQISRVAPAARIEVVHNPVQADVLFRWATPPLRPSGSGLVLVGAGRLTHQKGFDRLIELIPQLPGDTRLTIYGDGPDRGELEARIAELGLSERVTLPGFSEKVAAAMAGADAFVLPSRWEGLPNVVLESLTLGTPVIASDEAGVEDIASAASPGAVVIAPVDERFADAIRRRRPLGSAAPRASLLPDRYRSEAIAARFADVLAAALPATA